MTNYWCCKADFGEHESTCPNYRAPSEPNAPEFHLIGELECHVCHSKFKTEADFAEHLDSSKHRLDAVPVGAPSEPKVAPLTQAEVDALTDGTLVEVVWSGENGPHIYQLTHERGQTLVGPLPGKTGIKHSIKFVGETPPFTVIRMATPKPVIRQAIMPLSEPMICTRCKVKIGKGIKYYRTKNGPHHETCPTICPKCNGAGHADNAQFPCSTCYGSGSVITPKPVAAADVEKELLEELGFPDRPIKLEGVILEAVWLLLLRARRENRSLADTIYKWEHAVAREPVAVKTLNHIRNEYLRTVPQSQNDLRRTFLWWRDQAIRLQDENDKLRAEPANAPGAGTEPHVHRWQQHIYSQCTECGVMFRKEEKS